MYHHGNGDLERVQVYATWLVDGFCGPSYEAGLRLFKLYPVSSRRLCGDLVFIWEIIRGDMEPELKVKLRLPMIGRLAAGSRSGR